MKIPQEGDDLQLGDESLYVVEVEEAGSRSYGVQSGMDALDGRVVLTCHDPWGNEVEIRFYPEED